METMVSALLKRARHDEPVYITDVRKAFQAEGKRPFHIRVTLYDDSEKAYRLLLPDTSGEEEEEFIRNYLHAVIYNLLSVTGASHMAVYTDPADLFLTGLAEKLPETFQAASPLSGRTGYGKCLNVNERVLRTLKGEEARFSFSVHSIAEENTSRDPNPDPEEEADLDHAGPSDEKEPEALTLPEAKPSLLAELPGRAAGKTLLGLDIGGTDIKLVVSEDESLIFAREYDWDPASFRQSSQMLEAITSLISDTGLLYDGIGISFPDVVIEDRIVGGETAKTKGIRENPSADYEAEFDRISGLCSCLAGFLKEGGQVRCANDGTIAAFTSAVEQGRGNLICHSLGTDLGTGWVGEDGSSPMMPLELYNLVIDLGSAEQGRYPGSDVRSTRNLNSALAGSLQRYASQTGAFRLAVKILETKAPEAYQELFSKGFLRENADGRLEVPTCPEDLRKPFLEYLCSRTGPEEPDGPGNPYNEIFRQIGQALAVSWEETEFMLDPPARDRTLFGRLVKHPSAFEALCEGAHERVPELVLTAADESIANTVLMKQLAAHPVYTVAQFGQAVGAVYWGVRDRSR